MTFQPNKRPPHGKWAMLTAYDALMARQLEEGGADWLLVGDSMGSAVLGYEGVAQVQLGDMLHHCAAVCRGRNKVPVIMDLPAGSYASTDQAVESAMLARQAGADAVKLEGCLPDTIKAISDSVLPVMAHLGYTPQTGKPKVAAKDSDSARILFEEAKTVEAAGAVSLVVELVPREVSKQLCEALQIPVIGIGCGPDVDGQVLVTTDMWGDHDFNFKFLRKFARVNDLKLKAVREFVDAVRKGDYPSDGESFHMPKPERDKLDS